jgi:modulator of FtsH protease HflK
MPWDNNTGGPGRGNGGGPWGKPPTGGGGPRRGGSPNLEDILNRGRERFRGTLPGGGWAIAAGIAVILVVWLYNSIYTIAPQEVGVETTFGVPSNELETQGLHFLFWPVQTVERVNITQNKTDIGSVPGGGSNNSNEGMMLTSDQNIVDARYSVFWTVTDPKGYLFNVRQPDDMVRAISESAMREVVGRSAATDIFRSQRAGIENEVQKVIQSVADTYSLGVNIDQVRIEQVAPPEEVADAFAEVQRAQQDQTKYQEQARADANTLLGNARGQAAKIRQDAAAYKNQVVQNAEGEAARFISVYNQYVKAPDVTRRRLYLETMEQVLGQSNKVVVAPGTSGSGVVPYLPLPAVQPSQAPPTSPSSSSGPAMTSTPASGG